MTSVSIIVYGHPEPAGSKRIVQARYQRRPVLIDANKKAQPWKNMIAAEVQRQYDGDLLDGPLAVEFNFFRDRPRSHYRSGKNSHLLKDDAPSAPISKPDVDKLSRGTMDALTGQLWHDDAQVVAKFAAKHFGTPERVEIMVTQLQQPVGLDTGDGQLALVAA